jgi:hypothetical protein
MRARSAPNERERELLLHVVKAQQELEAALRLANDARRKENKSILRKQAYGRMRRTLLEAANHLNRIRGTHHISDDPEYPTRQEPEVELPELPAPPAPPASDS